MTVSHTGISQSLPGYLAEEEKEDGEECGGGQGEGGGQGSTGEGCGLQLLVRTCAGMY